MGKQCRRLGIAEWRRKVRQHLLLRPAEVSRTEILSRVAARVETIATILAMIWQTIAGRPPRERSVDVAAEPTLVKLAAVRGGVWTVLSGEVINA